ncbi:DUF4268 domain-containing protein [Halomarina litorea]|uniref:DUF4268 domain-containing protein n=1 Tax=Halomarina litorea TaxID=2961595 RepID=UPI0020C535D6|nr:DUF4268 domain-containing protein [Halomarina sp. BCD28]
MAEPQFASLELQDAREYWKHESRDFTPWLAEKIKAEAPSKLERTLGLDLNFIEREKSVGKYSVDILAEAADDGRNVVIENQLTTSDHDHLGKSIAYAAGVDADIIVWLAPQFNDEHRDAVQWLNEHSREAVDLFALRLEVWQIEDSPPAVRLNAVVEPSTWKEKAQRSADALTETEQLQEAFWTEFRNRAKETDTPMGSRKPKALHRYNCSIGRSGFTVSFVVDMSDDLLRARLLITDDAEAFRELKSQQEAIENEVGEGLKWDTPMETSSGNLRSQIYLTRQGDITDRENWDEYIEWMVEIGEEFYEAFGDRIQEIDT